MAAKGGPSNGTVKGGQQAADRISAEVAVGVEQKALGSYAAKQCPLRVFMENDPTEKSVAAPPDESLQALFDDGIDFEASIFDEIERMQPHDVVRVPGRTSGLSFSERHDLTVAAMNRGVGVVLGAVLPIDTVGRRASEIDVLVAGPVALASGKTAYRPVDVKNHRCTQNSEEASEPGFVTGLLLVGDGPEVELDMWTPRYREGDCLQLAHYYRALQAIGHAEPADPETGAVWAGIIGSERVVAWLDLNEAAFNTITPQVTGAGRTKKMTFHKRERKNKRSALDRYDFEFKFRLDMVDQANARTSRRAKRPVAPVKVGECATCPWEMVCDDELRKRDDVSLVRSVDYPAWSFLRFAGIPTVADLAVADPAVAVLADGPLTTANLVKLIGQANAELAGGLLVADGWDESAIPRCDIEIDLDLENNAERRTYLWGAVLHHSQPTWPELSGSYKSFASFEALDEAGEARLVAQLWKWLWALRRRAHAEGLTIGVYGYNSVSVEGSTLKRIAATKAASGLPSVSAVEKLLASDEWIDLMPLMQRKYLSNHGHGLKTIAVHEGFQWQDEEAGGLNSIAWYNEALAGGEGAEFAKTRIKQYNQDDCQATAWLRGLR